MQGNALGVPGLLVGSIPTWGTLLLVLLQTVIIVPTVWWIKGFADRKKANTEALVAEDDIIGRQWQRFEDECERLRVQMKALEEKVDKMQKELDQERNLRLEAEAKVIRYEAAMIGLGEGRNQAAAEVSGDRVGVLLPANMKKDARNAV